MSARDTLIGILRQWAEHHGAAPITPEALVDASDAELLREWAAKIREVGTAKGWSTWASAYMDPDTEFVGEDMPSTETMVAELRRLDRIATLRDAESAIAAAVKRNLAEHPDEQAMSARRLGLRAAERIVRGLREDTEAREKDTSGGGQPSAGESTPDSADVEGGAGR